MKYIYILPIFLLIFCKGRPEESSIIETKWQDESTRIIHYKLQAISIQNTNGDSIKILPILSKDYISGDCSFALWIVFKSPCKTLDHMNFLRFFSLDKDLKIPLIFKQKKENASEIIQISCAQLFDNDITLLETILNTKSWNKYAFKAKQRTLPIPILSQIKVELLNNTSTRKWILSRAHLDLLSKTLLFYKELKEVSLQKDYSF